MLAPSEHLRTWTGILCFYSKPTLVESEIHVCSFVNKSSNRVCMSTSHNCSSYTCSQSLIAFTSSDLQSFQSKALQSSVLVKYDFRVKRILQSLVCHAATQNKVQSIDWRFLRIYDSGSETKRSLRRWQDMDQASQVTLQAMLALLSIFEQLLQSTSFSSAPNSVKPRLLSQAAPLSMKHKHQAPVPGINRFVLTASGRGRIQCYPCFDMSIALDDNDSTDDLHTGRISL